MPELEEDELQRWGVVLPQHTFEDNHLAGIASGTGSDGGAHPKKQPPGAWPERGLASEGGGGARMGVCCGGLPAVPQMPQMGGGYSAVRCGPCLASFARKGYSVIVGVGLVV